MIKRHSTSLSFVSISLVEDLCGKLSYAVYLDLLFFFYLNKNYDMISNKQLLLRLDQSLEVELVSYHQSSCIENDFRRNSSERTMIATIASRLPATPPNKPQFIVAAQLIYLFPIPQISGSHLYSWQYLNVFIMLIEDRNLPLKSHKHKKTHTNFSAYSYHYLSSAMFSFVVSAIGITLLCIIGVPAIVFYFVRYSKRVMIPGLK